jgi:DNA-binding Lrp family transcriptional regulator
MGIVMHQSRHWEPLPVAGIRRRPAGLARPLPAIKPLASNWADHGLPPPAGLVLVRRIRGRPIRSPPASAGEISDMIPFFVQIKCKLGQSYTVANALAESEIASEIYSTAGDYDLLVKFYVDKDVDIGHFVNEKVQILPGIQDTHTIITFKAF